MESKTEACTTDQETPVGMGRYAAAVICIAVFCIGTCVYFLKDDDPMGLWFGALIGVCGLGMACYGWALMSTARFIHTGAHPWWSLLKPR